MYWRFYDVGKSEPRKAKFLHWETLCAHLTNYDDDAEARCNIITEHGSDEVDEVVTLDGRVVGSIGLPISKELAEQIEREFCHVH